MKIQIPVYLDDFDYSVSMVIDDILDKKYDTQTNVLNDTDQLKYDTEYNEQYNLIQDTLEEKSFEFDGSPAIILEIDTEFKTLKVLEKPPLTVLDEQKGIEPTPTAFDVPKLQKL